MDVIDNGNCADQWRAVSGASIFDTHICLQAEGKSACNVSFLGFFFNFGYTNNQILIDINAVEIFLYIQDKTVRYV